jgi:hypothetical protein
MSRDMPLLSKCPDCGADTFFIDTYRSGVVRCDKQPIEAISKTGREMEVFLVHKCDNTTRHNGTLQDKAEGKKEWTGGFKLQQQG